MLIPQPGANPFNPTIVTYDMSVKSNGCYKADAPPSFIGQQMMRDAGRQAGRSTRCSPSTAASTRAERYSCAVSVSKPSNSRPVSSQVAGATSMCAVATLASRNRRWSGLRA